MAAAWQLIVMEQSFKRIFFYTKAAVSGQFHQIFLSGTIIKQLILSRKDLVFFLETMVIC
jgi:hypothetical protein